MSSKTHLERQNPELAKWLSDNMSHDFSSFYPEQRDEWICEALDSVEDHGHYELSGFASRDGTPKLFYANEAGEVES